MAGYIGNKAVNLSTSGADISGTANLDIVDIDGAVNMATTALVTGVLTANGGAVFNESSADVDFRVESNGDANMLFVDGGNNAVGIGTGSPAAAFHVNSGLANLAGLFESTDAGATLTVIDNSTTGGSGAEHGLNTVGDQLEVRAVDNLSFETAAAERMRIDSTGAVTMPAQPAFQVKPASNQDNIAVGSAVSVVFGTEIFDQNADFASNTFTAPVTGKYHLEVHLYIESIDTAADYYQLKLITSNRTYYQTMDFGGHSADPVYGRMSLSVLADMDASDTSTVAIFQVAGTQQTDVKDLSYFSGYLAC